MDQGTEELRDALDLMRTALSLIDKAEVAHDVGAHLDLAINRLSEQLSSRDPAVRPKEEVGRNGPTL